MAKRVPTDTRGHFNHCRVLVVVGKDNVEWGKAVQAQFMRTSDLFRLFLHLGSSRCWTFSYFEPVAFHFRWSGFFLLSSTPLTIQPRLRSDLANQDAQVDKDDYFSIYGCSRSGRIVSYTLLDLPARE